MIDSVADLSYSIGYVGLDSVMYSMHFNTTSSCKVKVARVKNKAGNVVRASVESAQSAVRSKLSILVDRSLCPGFGMCVDVQDGDDPDVWPITAVTVPTPSPIRAISRNRLRDLRGAAAVHHRGAEQQRHRGLRADEGGAGLRLVDPGEPAGRVHRPRAALGRDARQGRRARRRHPPQHDLRLQV